MFQAIGVIVIAAIIVAGAVSTLRRVNVAMQTPQKRKTK